MNGELARAEAEVLANAAAAVAAAVANLPDPGGQQLIPSIQAPDFQGQTDQDDQEEGSAGGAGQDGQGQARKPRKLRKPNDVARCQVDGCGRDLSDAKLYLRRYSVCEPHFKAEWVTLSGGRYRFCQQCNKFQSLDNFAGNRRSCKTRSEDRNIRRRKQRTDERAAAGDEADGAGVRALKGPQMLGALSLPSRAALCDNGVLRQLGNDPSDPANQFAAVQYASQVQQFLLASGGAGAAAVAGIAPVGGGGASLGGGGGGGGLQVQLPMGMDLAAALAGAADLGGLGGGGGGAQNASALSLLTAVARGGVGAGDGSNVLQQLQLAQLAATLSKGGGGGGGAAGMGGGGGGAAANGGGLAAALGGVGLGMGLNALGGALNVSGALGGGLNGSANLAQQLLLQQAATAVGGGGGGGGGPNGAGSAVGVGSLADAAGGGSGLTGNLDLQNFMAQQILQQTAAGGQGPPLVLLSNQNVMLVSLDNLGLLQQQAK
ncbi:Squamosa promoter-binding-like protein [Pleodorina starrii]|nr:Squamosa promoter-binding-like protein [Pleodorina starrii]GLC74655.1 Squamosa promoter-binding-like protein [Pleodorina starrii]